MLATAWLLAGSAALASAAASSTTCNGKSYSYQELAGYGFVASDARDKFGDTLGGIGSSIAVDLTTWQQDPANASRYTGVLWGLPDRGWNTEGTLNFIPRVHKFNMTLTLVEGSSNKSASPNLDLTYLDTILFLGPDGKPTTGLDGDASGHLTYEGFPDLPVSTFEGDGFGNSGGKCGANRTSRRIPLDPEGLVLNADGTFWVSDEYGPYIYHFGSDGKMLSAIRPPEAYIPKRNGSDSFSADSPPHYDNGGQGDDVWPADNPTGRDNNHGFEGLSASPDGKTLYVLLQAANNQEGGLSKQTERWTRLLKYDVSNPSKPVAEAEYVVGLPLYNDPTKKKSKNPVTAAQSEVHFLPNGQLFVLARDSGAGHGQDVSTSQYRHIDIVDLEGATNILGDQYDCATCAIADDDGVLDTSITNATYCSFLDFNDNAELARFGLHNGGDQDAWLLNEKWESIAVAPVGKDGDDEYFVFSVSDNDFITQNGFMKSGQFPYADSSGFNLDCQALVFRVQIPK